MDIGIITLQSPQNEFIGNKYPNGQKLMIYGVEELKLNLYENRLVPIWVNT
jgi:hypothetical protein